MITFNGDLAPLFEALSKAQSAIDPARKKAKNPHFKSRYADLSEVLGAILPPLNANGLSLMQIVGESSGSLVTLTTVLTHKTGAYISSLATCPQGRGGGPQGVGSGITYLRRYSAQSIVGLPTEDDDGNGAQKDHEKAKKAKPEQSAYFKENRKSLMVDWVKKGWEYEVICYVCESKGNLRPSGMSKAQIKGLNTFLEQCTDEQRQGYQDDFDQDIGGAP